MRHYWKPGDVVTNNTGARWFIIDDETICNTHGDRYKIDLLANGRPLVVIDPEDYEQVERLRASLESMSFSPWACGAAACLTSALRSLIEPPKPEEPTGLGAVVEDGQGRTWIRVDWNYPWCPAKPQKRESTATHGVHRPWSEINAVKILSEGVHS